MTKTGSTWSVLPVGCSGGRRRLGHGGSRFGPSVGHKRHMQPVLAKEVQELLVLRNFHVEEGGDVLVAAMGRLQTLSDDRSDLCTVQVAVHERLVGDFPEAFFADDHPLVHLMDGGGVAG